MSKRRLTTDRWWPRFYKKLATMDETDIRALWRVIEHELALRTSLREAAAKEPQS